MKKIKQAAYAVFVLAFVTVPAVAGAAITGVSGGGWDSGKNNAGNANLPGGTIFNIISNTMNWLLAILGFIGIIGFVISGILYLTAAGDETQIEKAKSAMMYSIIGIIVALIGFVIIRAVDTWLSGTSMSF